MTKPLPSQKRLQELLRYDKETGRLYWRPRCAEMFSEGLHGADAIARSWNSRYAGRWAFSSIDGHGYHVGAIDYRQLRAQRVIWKLVTGKEPKGQIDHIDGDRTNNRFANLRDITHAENQKNKALQKNNTSGHSGVSWHRQREKWQAHIKVDGRLKHLGYFNTRSEAIIARKADQKKHGFSERHGQPLRHHPVSERGKGLARPN